MGKSDFGLGDFLEKISSTKEVLELKDEFKTIFKEFGIENLDELKTKVQSKQVFPAVNTIKEDNRYLILVDLPGFASKEDIDLEVEDDTITISGERIKAGEYLNLESTFGKFSRTFNLPDNSNVKNISANYDNGVLYIVIPKKKEKKKQKIKVG